MLEKELQNYIKLHFPKENKNIEHKKFSSLKNNISWKGKEDVISYIAWISNVEGGFLILWVEDETINIKWIKKFAWFTIENIKQRILWNTLNLDSEKFDVIEYKTDDTSKIVWVFEIPKHNPRKIVIAHNKKYQRMGDTLEYMTPEKEIEILNEPLIKIDWSSLVCEWTTLEDLDENAVTYLREKLKEAKKDDKWLNMSLKNLLNSIWLLTDDIPNNTCILFLWKTSISDKYIKERNKISWKYVDSKNDIEERMSIEEQKAPLILTLERIKHNINRFNTYLKDIDLFRTDIRQYDEKATIEELLINSLAHRDWTINFWNEIIQTPISLEFRNPWIFRADLEKVLKENQSKEYLNPTMSEFFLHLNLMEKERWWLQKAYSAQLRKWTTIRFFQRENRVDFIVSWRIENEDFAKLVFKRTDIELDDLLLLDKIASWKIRLWTDINKDQARDLKEKWYIEINWQRKICNFSKELAEKLWITWKRHKYNKFTKSQEEAEILNFLKENWEWKTADFTQIFEWKKYTYDMVYNIVRRLKKKDLIEKKWKDIWILLDSVKKE